MSELSVNDHLEGILSDFEALKRSFDIEDVDDIPSFASASPVSSPLPPASPHFFMNHTKAAKAAVSQSPAGSYSSSSVPYPSHMNPAPNFSPLPRPRAVVTSLSFNKGSTNKPLTHNNGSSVTRAASFQSRFSPNGYSVMFGAGSDNDSLHSSTSSLEYSGGGSKLLSYPSPCTSDEYHHISQQHVDANFNQRKFSPGPESGEVSSKPILDLHSPNGEGGVAVGRNGAGGRLSPGFKFANANWNGRFRNASSFGEENHSFNNHSQKQAAPSKDRKTPQLNKFPLDLDSIVSPPSASPKPCVRSPEFQQRSPCSGVASPSASLSSLDSSDTPPLSLHQSCAPTTPPGSRPVPEVSSYPVPLSPAQTPHLEILSGPQVGQLDSKPSSYSVSSPSSPRKAPGLSEVDSDDVRDSVGSILQRIASFSQSALHSTPMTFSDRRNGTSPSFGHLTMPSGPPEHQKKSAGDLELVVPMEDQEATPTSSSSSSSSSPEGKRQDVVQAQDGSSPGAEPMDHGQVHMDISSSEGSPLDDNTLGLGPQGWDSSSREAQSQEPLDNCRERLENGVHTGTEETGVEREGPLEPCLTDSFAGLDISYISGSDLFGYVGIEAVLDQMRRKTMKAGFEFNIMVVGQSGLGKSTLVNTLFKSKVSRKSCTSSYQEKISKTVKIHSVSHMIEEKGVKMKLTVVDTPGFGDQIDNSDCWEPIVKYVNEQYEKYLREELNVMRKRRIPDTRVHCCVYFLPATGHRLRAIDVEFMKHLGSIVSIVPVIAKADTLTLEERLEFKQRIRQDLAANGIQVYPQEQYDEDPEERLLNNSIRECIPFAVVGTDREHQVNGNKVLGRKTKWGIIEVENAAHCEFSHLRDLLIRSHLQDLKDVTHNVLYETYRVRRLNQANLDFSELELAPIESLGPLRSGTPDKCETESHL